MLNLEQRKSQGSIRMIKDEAQAQTDVLHRRLEEERDNTELIRQQMDLIKRQQLERNAQRMTEIAAANAGDDASGPGAPYSHQAMHQIKRLTEELECRKNCFQCKSHEAEITALRGSLARLDNTVARWFPLPKWEDLDQLMNGENRGGYGVSLERRILALVERANTALEEQNC